MRIRIHRPVNKSSTPINTTLVAKQQKQQPVNHPKLDAPDPKFNFDLSKIPISSSDRPSSMISPKLDNRSLQKKGEDIVRGAPTKMTFDQPKIVTGRVVQVGKRRTSTQEIDKQVNRLKSAINFFWGSYRDGLSAFQTKMIFESKQEAEPQYLDATFKATGKFILDQAIGKLPGPWGTAANLLKNVAESWMAEKARADGAAGGAKIGEYIATLWQSVGSKEKLMLKAVKGQERSLADQYYAYTKTSPNRGEATESGVIVGDAAKFLQELKVGIDAFESAIPKASVFQQQFTEAFAQTGALTDVYTPAARISGQLYLSINLYKNGDAWKVESVDNAWTLATTAPKPERLAENLKMALKDQGLQSYQTNLPKLVSIRIEVEKEWALNDYREGHIYFESDPSDYEFRGFYSPSLFKEAWEKLSIRKAAIIDKGIIGSKK